MVLNQLHLQVSWMHPEIHSETRWLTQDSERTRDPKTFHRGLTLFSGLLPALKVRPQRTRHSGLWPQCCLTGRKPQIQTSGGSHTSCKFSCETLPFFWAFTPTEGLHQGSHLCHLSDKRFKGGKVSISQHDAYDSSLCHFNLPKPMIQRPSKNDTMVFPHLDFALPMLHLGAAVRVVKKKTCSQGSLYYQPKQCTIEGISLISLKTTMHVHCYFDPPEMGNHWCNLSLSVILSLFISMVFRENKRENFPGNVATE